MLEGNSRSNVSSIIIKFSCDEELDDFTIMQNKYILNNTFQFIR